MHQLCITKFKAVNFKPSITDIVEKTIKGKFKIICLTMYCHLSYKIIVIFWLL